MNDYPKNFSRAEMLISNTATRKGISNEPDNPEHEANILKTAWQLQALRNKLTEASGKDTPIRVLSVYRSKKVNSAVGGSKTSAHMKGLASDIVVPGMSNKALCEFIAAHFKYDQIIQEFPESGGWVHWGIANENPRSEKLTAIKVAGRTVYARGFA